MRYKIIEDIQNRASKLSKNIDLYTTFKKLLEDVTNNGNSILKISSGQREIYIHNNWQEGIVAAMIRHIEENISRELYSLRQGIDKYEGNNQWRKDYEESN